MEEKKVYIALLSGGRDSTAMVELLLRKGEPLDYIMFNDTTQEHGVMYEYLDKFDKHIQEKYGMSITYTKPTSTFEEFVFGRIKWSNNGRKGMIRGLPNLTTHCDWRSKSKVTPGIAWIRKHKIKNPHYYVGFTYSEKHRANGKKENYHFPLIDWQMCEADVDRILNEIDMINPLYDTFERTGCAMCPYKKDREWYVLYKNYPDIWEWMKDIEDRLLKLRETDEFGVVSPTWGGKGVTMRQREEKFDKSDGKYPIEAPESCECKIELPDIQINLFKN